MKANADGYKGIEEQRQRTAARPRRVLRLLAAAILPLALASCYNVQIREYPDSWKPLADRGTEECPNIAGVYKEWGIYYSIDFKGTRREFKTGLSAALGLTGDDTTHVRLTQPRSDTLEATAFSGDKQVDQKQFSKRKGFGWLFSKAPALSEFTCSAEGLTFPTGSSAVLPAISGTVPPTGFGGTKAKTFRLAEDGSLVANVTNTFVLLLLLPVAYEEKSEWMGWKPAPVTGPY